MITDNIFDSREYKTSRRAYSAQCAFEYFISILCTDAFLAKLLKSIGLSDALTGVLSSLISFTFLFQLLSIPIAGKTKNVKKTVMLLDTASQLFFACIYAVPFLPFGKTAKGFVVTLFILLGYLALYLNSSVCYKWGNSFVSPDKRGSFSAVKEMVSLVSGMAFTLLMGLAADSFENRGNLPGAFRFIALCMVVICGFNFFCFTRIRENTLKESTAAQSAVQVINRTFRNRKCRNAMILTAVTEFARYMSTGFMGTYKTVDLGYSVSQIQLMNIGANIGRFIISKPLGSYSDKKTYADGYYLGIIISLFSYITGVFTSPGSRWLAVVFNALLQMSYAGTGQNTSNMMYAYVDDEYVLSAISVNNSVRGVCGFAASFTGGLILDRVQKAGNTVFGKTVYGQQILCLLSAVLTLAAIIFNKTVVIKQEEEKK